MGLIADLIGWIGAVLVLVAYFMITKGVVNARSRLYQAMNLIGGSFLGYNTFVYSAYPSTLVNIFWVGIAIYGLWKTI